MENKIERKAIGTPVTPADSLISNLVDEIHRRHMGGERLVFILAELQARLKLDDREMYVLKSELNKYGVQLEINDEAWFVPTERRTASFKSTRIAKIYGSRTDDIAISISALKEDLKEINSWLSANAKASYMNPQAFYEYSDKLAATTNRIKDLTYAATLAGAKEIYAGLKKVNIVGFEEIGNELFAIVKTADAQSPDQVGEETALSAVNTGELSKTSPLGDMKQDIKEGITPNTEVETGKFSVNTRTVEHFDPTKITDVKEVLLKSGNELVVEAVKVAGEDNATVDKFLADVIAKIKEADAEETQKEVAIDGITEFKGGLQGTKVEGSIAQRVKYADFRFPEKSLASALMTFDRINEKLAKLSASNAINGNLKVAESLGKLKDAVKRAQDYIKMKMPYADNIQKQAAAVVLKGIANSLETMDLDMSALDTIKNQHKGYIIASLEPIITKLNNMFLLIEEE